MAHIVLHNPSTGQTEETFPRFHDDDRDVLLDRSTAAFRTWRASPIGERARILRRTADLYREHKSQLAGYIGREMGKLRRQGESEITLVADIYDWYAEHAHALLADRELPAQGAVRTFVRREPLGPVLGIMPWNFPYYQVARWAAPNLLLGNTLILKHASICPLSSRTMAELFAQAGLPVDVFRNIHASGSQMEAFISDPRITAVSLTGSEEAGAAVAKAAGANHKKSLLELGGNDPFLVLDDHNLAQVLTRYVSARMANTGQACNAPKRLIVLEECYGRALDFLTQRIRGLTVGTWDDADARVGPLSSVEARDEVVARLAAAEQAGQARIVVGGRRIDRPGAFMEPTLLTDVDPASDVGCKEIFGPVAILYRAGDVEEAVALANDTDYGLGSYVFSSDLELAQQVASRMAAGMTYINETGASRPGLPFGGIGRSGYGRELGEWGLREFANEHLYRVSAPL